ncbi:MAG: hypothetical protein KGR68_18245, partial [Betaproteobacteria bacterium]|nr:hypothetical protein [Betaproteobacteria bacterium]
MAIKHITDRIRAKRPASRRAEPRLEAEVITDVERSPVDQLALGPIEAQLADADRRQHSNDDAGSAGQADSAADANSQALERAAEAGASATYLEYARGWFGEPGVMQFAQAAGGSVTDTTAAVSPAASGGFSPGLGSLFGVLGALGLAGSASGGGGLAGDASAGAASKREVNANMEVINGYVMGATVWQDNNNNGKLDAGEPVGWWDKNGNGKLDDGEQKSSAEGRITLQLDPQGGPVRTLDGTDLSTGKRVTNSFSSPARGSVI